MNKNRNRYLWMFPRPLQRRDRFVEHQSHSIPATHSSQLCWLLRKLMSSSNCIITTAKCRTGSHLNVVRLWLTLWNTAGEHHIFTKPSTFMDWIAEMILSRTFNCATVEQPEISSHFVLCTQTHTKQTSVVTCYWNIHMGTCFGEPA